MLLQFWKKDICQSWCWIGMNHKSFPPEQTCRLETGKQGSCWFFKALLKVSCCCSPPTQTCCCCCCKHTWFLLLGLMDINQAMFAIAFCIAGLLCEEWKLTEVGEGFFNHRIRSDHFRLDHFCYKITWNVASICLLDSLLLLFQKNHLAAIDQLFQNRTVMILKARHHLSSCESGWLYDNSRNHGLPPFHASLFLMAAVVLSVIRVEEIKTMFQFQNRQSIGSIQEQNREKGCEAC